MDRKILDAYQTARRSIDFLLEEFRKFYGKEYEKRTSNSLIFIKKNVEKLSFINKLLSGISTEASGVKVDAAIMNKIATLQRNIQVDLKSLSDAFSDLRGQYVKASVTDSQKLKDSMDRLLLSYRTVKGLYIDFEIAEDRPVRTTFSKNKKRVDEYEQE